MQISNNFTINQIFKIVLFQKDLSGPIIYGVLRKAMSKEKSKSDIPKWDSQRKTMTALARSSKEEPKSDR